MEQQQILNLNSLEKDFGILTFEDKKTHSLRIESLGQADLVKVIPAILDYAASHRLKKITVKASDAQAVYFYQHGFCIEASIPAYFGMQDAIFVVRYFETNEPNLSTDQEEILNMALGDSVIQANRELLTDIVISKCEGVFSEHISNQNQVCFTGVEKSNASDSIMFTASLGNKVIATADSQLNKADKAVEFSNFVVNVEYEPNILISCLLADMESYYLSIGCQTSYTLVSADSLIINKTCADNNYEFGGTLKNELIINEAIASLNTWFKRL
ncbi:hypothetical protein tloyanaT_08110 [Thalassotalea loyana]|uniref:Uncharacterized protein n=1 Tax=Thalassotalea loyana TaxID=280483 RepID=A0ABQ6HAV0_9GAMM|nr:hypothetical protein [Thalassotalea loyana]GLX84559.1 hypothetical protein tloyanaT_08110 [Thalassotalea loyana]